MLRCTVHFSQLSVWNSIQWQSKRFCSCHLLIDYIFDLSIDLSVMYHIFSLLTESCTNTPANTQTDHKRNNPHMSSKTVINMQHWKVVRVYEASEKNSNQFDVSLFFCLWTEISLLNHSHLLWYEWECKFDMFAQFSFFPFYLFVSAAANGDEPAGFGAPGAAGLRWA